MRQNENRPSARAIPTHGNTAPGPRPALVTTGLAMLVLMLSACGAGESATPEDPATQVDATSEAEDPEQAAADEVSLIADIGAEPASLDPMLDDGPRFSFQWSIQEGLTERDGPEVLPLLAESWELDGTTWRFTLRENVQFHGGEPLTSADVVASWERMMSERSTLSVVPEGTQVTAVDERTVEISRDVVDPTIPVKAAEVLIVPEAYADLSDNRVNEEMPGTGPYVFQSWEKGSSMSFSKFDDYWDPSRVDDRAPDAVELRFNPETSVRFASLQAGEIDLALNMTPDLAVDESLQVIAGPVSEILTVELNTKHGPLTDQRLREAVNYAIDRQAIIDQIYQGYAEPANAQMVGSGVFGHNHELEDFPYDPDRARQLLEEADAVGTELTMIGTRGRWMNDVDAAEAVTAMLNDVGFVVELEIPTYDVFLDNNFGSSDQPESVAETTILNSGVGPSDPSVRVYLHCEGRASAICIDEVDQIIEEASVEPDDDRREELYNEMWEILKEHAAFAAIADVYQLRFASSGLEWVPRADGYMRFHEMSLAD